MEFMRINGKTKEEAIQKAVEALHVPEEKMEIEVVEEGSKGFLGIGARDYVINARKRIGKEEVIEEFLEEVFSTLSISADIDIEPGEENIYVRIKGDDAAILIGRRGESLDALQLIVNIVANKQAEGYERIILDIENYRDKREQSLVAYAKKMAKKAVYRKRNIKLEPMNPYERRIVHYALQGDPMVTTFSEGEDPYRKVVISVKKSGYKD